MDKSWFGSDAETWDGGDSGVSKLPGFVGGRRRKSRKSRRHKRRGGATPVLKFDNHSPNKNQFGGRRRKTKKTRSRRRKSRR